MSRKTRRLQPRAPDDDDRVQVRFACGATLQCPDAHLPERVRLLKAICIEASELRLILEGIDLDSVRRRKRWQHAQAPSG